MNHSCTHHYCAALSNATAGWPCQLIAPSASVPAPVASGEAVASETRDYPSDENTPTCGPAPSPATTAELTREEFDRALSAFYVAAQEDLACDDPDDSDIERAVITNAYSALRASRDAAEKEAERLIRAQNKTDPDRKRGLYGKYNVTRLNDRDGKHTDCWYFVLDTEHDRFALDALAAYSDACAVEYPTLADDLRSIIRSRRHE